MAHATGGLKIPSNGTEALIACAPAFLPLLPAWALVRAAGRACAESLEPVPSLGVLVDAFHRCHPRPLSGCGVPLVPVAPPPTRRQGSGKERRAIESPHPERGLAQAYQARLFLKGELLTRPGHWHDVFGALTHLAFPLTKAVLNARQFWELDADGVSFPYGTGEGARRNPAQDMLTHFDEAGLVVAARDPDLVAALRARRWKEVFWRRRDALAGGMEFFVFGHALHESFLCGLRALHGAALAVEVDAAFFAAPLEERVGRVDALASLALQNVVRYCAPSSLFPVPFLGFPGFVEETASEAYYEDGDYFRELLRSARLICATGHRVRPTRP